MYHTALSNIGWEVDVSDEVSNLKVDWRFIQVLISPLFQWVSYENHYYYFIFLSFIFFECFILSVYRQFLLRKDMKQHSLYLIHKFLSDFLDTRSNPETLFMCLCYFMCSVSKKRLLNPWGYSLRGHLHWLIHSWLPNTTLKDNVSHVSLFHCLLFFYYFYLTLFFFFTNFSNIYRV